MCGQTPFREKLESWFYYRSEPGERDWQTMFPPALSVSQEDPSQLSDAG